MAHCARLFSLPYHGTLGEDRWAWGDDRWGCRTWALCDGASESYDAAGWARELATALVRFSHPPKRFPGPHYEQDAQGTVKSGLAGTLERAVQRAQRDYGRRVQRKPGGPSDWLTRGAQKRGSWSTALGIRIPANGASVDAWAVGDTELFLLDGYEERLRFPLRAVKDFTSSPFLIGSQRLSTAPQWRYLYSSLRSFHHPKIILVSDGLAAFIMRTPTASSTDLWSFLLRTPLPELSRWIRQERDGGRIPSDDYTLLEIRP